MLARRTIESEFGIFYTADQNRLNDETRFAPDLLGRAKLQIADTRVPQDPDAGEPRYRFLQELNLLAAEFRSIEEQAGEVPARTAETSSPPVRHWVAFKINPDDGDGGRRSGGSPDRVWASGEDHIAFARGQFVGDFGKPLDQLTVDASLEYYAVAIDVPGVS